MGPNQIATVLAALIVGAAIIGTQFVGRYQIIASRGEDSVVAWRLNARTGEVDYCFVSKNRFNQFDPDPKDHQFSVECKKDIRSGDVKP